MWRSFVVSNLSRCKVLPRPFSTTLTPFLSRSLTSSPNNPSEIRIDFPEDTFTTHKLSLPPNHAVTSREELMTFYRQMFLMRRMEIVADQLYKEKFIRGFLHLYNGQEAICAGVEAAITKQDHIITAYRDHAMYVGRGGTPLEVFGELLGRESGCSRGKGGSMHMYRRETNFYGGNGIVGAQVPVGAGIALAQKYLKTGKVTLAFYGDGAANQGQVFEAYNMAALWKLPVLFVCENNHYAMGTSTSRAAASTSYYSRGDYVPGLRINGMDVLAVKTGVKHAVEYALSAGPVVLEMSTYRYVGHSMSDPGTTYRTRDEITKVRESKDPINLIKSRLLQFNFATENEIKTIEKQVRTEIDEAIEQAKKSPAPDLKETYTDVLIEPAPIRAVELVNSYVPS